MKSVYLFLFLGLTLGACRYKDGPSISFRTAKNRVTNTWIVDKYSSNGADHTSNFHQLFPNYTLIIRKDGNYTLTTTGVFGFTENGKWEFQTNATKINLRKDGSGTNVWNITRLKSTEFWANQRDNNGDLLELRFKSK